MSRKRSSGAQRAEELVAGRARLFDLSPLHGTRDVDDERDVARRYFTARNRRRRDREQREAVFVAGRVRQHADRRRAAASQRNEERDVARVAAHGRDTPPIAVGHVERVRRRVGSAELARRAIRKRERRRAGVARHRFVLAGAAEVVDAKRVAFTRRHALEAHDDALLFAGIEREDACTKQPVSHPFDERRIALRANDVLVDAARGVGVHRLAGHELAVDRELQVLKRGVVRQRKEIVGFADRAAAIDESLLDFVLEHAIGELDAHVAPCSRDVRAAVPNRDVWDALVHRARADAAGSWDDPSLGKQLGWDCKGDEQQRPTH